MTVAGKGGPPLVELTENQIKMVEELAASLNTSQLSDYLGISHVTFKAIRDRDERVSFAYKNGKAKAIAKIANSLINKAAEGDTASMMFYLKTQAGWKETTVVDNKSSDGSMATGKSMSDFYKDVSTKPES